MEPHGTPSWNSSWNSCRQVIFSKDELDVLKSQTNDIVKIVEPYVDYYLNNKNFKQRGGAVIYDLAVPMYYLYPQMFTVENGDVNVHTYFDERHGQTTFRPHENSTIKLVRNINSQMFKEIFAKALS
ncbi:hypothetical protein HY003_00010 [Candidatus Saccharibacteria bacterium]|nr:hypothetical protein [Candidatus Saccharibacteria bacterium]MBI3337674.1 hypothetical protein [Candidatus Saccharibacteria bacterium]